MLGHSLKRVRQVRVYGMLCVCMYGMLCVCIMLCVCMLCVYGMRVRVTGGCAGPLARQVRVRVRVMVRVNRVRVNRVYDMLCVCISCCVCMV